MEGGGREERESAHAREREREKERESARASRRTHVGESVRELFASSFYVFSLHLGLPYANWA